MKRRNTSKQKCGSKAQFNSKEQEVDCKMKLDT